MTILQLLHCQMSAQLILSQRLRMRLIILVPTFAFGRASVFKLEDNLDKSSSLIMLHFSSYLEQLHYCHLDYHLRFSEPLISAITTQYQALLLAYRLLG